MRLVAAAGFSPSSTSLLSKSFYPNIILSTSMKSKSNCTICERGVALETEDRWPPEAIGKFAIRWEARSFWQSAQK